MAKIISPEDARRLIQEYQNQNAAAGGPNLKATTGELLKGFFVDKSSLNDITSDPNNNGIILYLAKDPDNEGSKENNFILAYTGVETNAKSLSSGTIYGTPTCPPTCS
jgi:hypothetical protein